ncbi:FAD/NAD(P)-binding domain-containing protein [Dothidotthia symphoricarpi CBS 119687]|uniref:FAD/NAD(P)-binding domain-containing protein n=1 Tax=Dothidotthia symphoricarpi CBS 119687 TaxID=1392245 RepID=A0A6A6AMM8_9PLEO|nr:FAD/NAD(P)-binding domain-containing protein [Dothidotthia symphoricarpi CBS 119687]KAF2133040.1 FAD/NAD(P)-binding domain-containing protein [Dothidotthia symphoricarpi CBS 119687]
MAHGDECTSMQGTARGTGPRLPVLIIGAGSTGLALAQGLRKADIACTVFEKNPDRHGERDWNMGLHWGGPALQSLMLPESWARLQEVQVDPHVPTKALDTLNWLQGDTGESLAAFTFGPFYRLRRSKLRALLSQGLDIQYDKRLASITYAHDGQSVTAHFDDGTSATGRLLAGADGARSATRSLLLGPDLGAIHRIPFAATFVQRSFTADQALFLRSFHPLYLASAHPDNKFAFFGLHDVADAHDPSSWVFFFYISWPSSLDEQDRTQHWTDAERLAQQKEYAKSFCDPWKSAYEWTPDDAPVWYMGLTDWDPGRDACRWDNHGGLVTMLGDAVHPMTYQRGQGLNHSVTDAGKLRDALVKIDRGGDQKEAITAFEDEMIARGGKEVRDGTANTMLLHDWERVKQSPLFTKGMKKGD